MTKGLIMNKRNNNNKLAALAVAVAASAIGAGAVVSGNAMAGSNPVDTATDSVSVVSLDADGAIQCSFDGVDLPALVKNAGAGLESPVGAIAVGELTDAAVVKGQVMQALPVPGDAATGQSFTVTVGGVVPGGEALPSDATIVDLAAEGSGSAGTISVVPSAHELPEGLQPISVADARQGTADECADMLAGLTVAP